MHCNFPSQKWFLRSTTDIISSVEDTSIRYVAEENIEILETDEVDSLKSLAGRYFKRWDKEKKVFVSNICDEYPDD
jgi:F-box protein 21